MERNVSFFLEPYLRQFADESTVNYTLLRWYVYMFPYIPFRTGTLASTAELKAENTQLNTQEAFDIGKAGIDGNIHFKVPYANRMNNGDGFNFTKDFHPLACAHWEQVAFDLYGKEIEKQTKEYVLRSVKR